MDLLSGRVTSVLWRDDFTGQTMARLAPVGKNPKRVSYAFRGTFAHTLYEGEVLTLQGGWEPGATGEEIFMVKTIERLPPTSADGEISFLTGYIKGMTKPQAKLLLEKFGGLQGLIEVCKTSPQKISELMPKARKVVARLRGATWDRKEMDFDLFAALQSAGLRPGQVQELVRFFGATALRNMAQTTPYDFCQVPKIGFSSAEKVAKFYAEAQGRPVDLFNEERLIYGLCDVVGRERMQGDICCTEERVVRSGVKYLGLPWGKETETRLRDALGNAIKRRLLVKEFDFIYARGLHKAESDLALHIGKLVAAASRPLLQSVTVMKRDLEGRGLSTEQRDGVITMATNPVSILVGGPGRGKTHTLKSLVMLLDKYKRTYMLLAPTGKAAKRASEMTGKDCQTIHKACGLDREEDINSRKYGGKLGKRDRFNVDVIIVDESSMIDLALGFELFRRVKPGRTAIILVGDPDQLPPVSAGQVFKDLLNAEVIPAAKLTQVFRQANGSPIVDGADMLNSGQMPEFRPSGFEVRLFDPASLPNYPASSSPQTQQAFETRKTKDWLAQAIARYTKDKGLNPVRDIQVYAPQKKGDLGLAALNEALQAQLNPPTGKGGPVLKIADSFPCRVGDKVMQTKNNYRLRLSTASKSARDFGKSGARTPENPELLKECVSVMNGQVGYVTRLDPVKMEMEVTYDDLPAPVLYLRGEEWRCLTPAFAMSVHKSQGSECKYAFLVIPSGEGVNQKLVNRPLIYTGWTRAKEGVAVFARADAVLRAAKNLDGTARNSNLPRRLKQSIVVTAKKKISMFRPPAPPAPAGPAQTVAAV